MELPTDCIDIVQAETDSLNPNGLCFSQGEIIFVTSKNDHSQWEGRIGSVKGIPLKSHSKGHFSPNHVKSILEESPSLMDDFFAAEQVLEYSDTMLKNDTMHSSPVKPDNKNRELPPIPSTDTTPELEPTIMNTSYEFLLEKLLNDVALFNQATKNNATQLYASSVLSILKSIGVILENTHSILYQHLTEDAICCSCLKGIHVYLGKLMFGTLVALGRWSPAHAILQMRYHAGRLVAMTRLLLSRFQDYNLLQQEEKDQDAIYLNFITTVTKSVITDGHEWLDGYLQRIATYLAEAQEISMHSRDVSAVKEAILGVAVRIGNFLSLVDSLDRLCHFQVKPIMNQVLNLILSNTETLIHMSRESEVDFELLHSVLDELFPLLDEAFLNLRVLLDQPNLVIDLLALQDGMIENQGLDQLMALAQTEPSPKHQVIASIECDTPPIKCKSPKESKVERLLGKEAVHQMGIEEFKHTYLRPDYPPEDLKFNFEGDVLSGTLDALIEHLTSHEAPDWDYVHCFMMRYNDFCSAQTLYDKLVSRFMIPTPPKLNENQLSMWIEKKRTPIRRQVYQVMLIWMTEYSESTDTVLPLIKAFAKEHMSKENVDWGSELVKLVKKRMAGTIEKPRPLSTEQRLPSIFPTVQELRSVLDVDAMELARQMTLIQAKIFSEIEVEKLLKTTWEKLPSIQKYRDHSYKVSLWVAKTILFEQSSKNQATVLKHWIKSALYLFKMNNFYGVKAILDGLKSPSVRSSEKAWMKLGTKGMTNYKALVTHIEVQNYLSTVAKTQGPCLPIIELHSKEMDSTPNVNEPEGHLSFKRLYRECKIILLLKRFQRVNFAFLDVEMIRRWILKCAEMQ